MKQLQIKTIMVKKKVLIIYKRGDWFIYDENDLFNYDGDLVYITPSYVVSHETGYSLMSTDSLIIAKEITNICHKIAPFQTIDYGIKGDEKVIEKLKNVVRRYITNKRLTD